MSMPSLRSSGMAPEKRPRDVMLPWPLSSVVMPSRSRVGKM